MYQKLLMTYLKALNDQTWGSKDYTEEYIKVLSKIHRKLLKIKSKF